MGVIAEEEKELIENEKTDEPEKTEEVKEEEEKTEPKKVHLLQKLFGKRKDFVVPKIDEVTKTDKEIINEEEKTEEKAEDEKEEKEKVQHKFKKLFSMKKAKKEEKEEEKAEDKVEEGEEKKDDEKKDEEEKKDDEKKEGEEAIEEVSDVDVSTSTAEKKSLMQKLMTIKRDLMANKKEDKVEEEKKEGEEEVDAEKKEGEEEVKAEGEEAKEEETKDELGNEKPKPSNRIKKFFSMKRQRKTTETEDKPEEEKKEEEEKTEEGEKKEGEEEVKKEEEVVEQIVETILRIQLQNRTPTIPTLSAMQLKLESWIKFHGVKYENVQDKDNLPASALLPMQSNDYLTSLATKEEKMVMPMELDAEQKNIQHAMISLAEKNIHFAILSWQCSNLENTLKGYNINLQTYLNSKAPLALLKLFFKNNFCKNGLKMVKSNGFSQTTTEELDKLAKNDLKVLAEMLGEKEFFFGNAASLLDLVAFSHLAQVTVVDESASCPLRDHMKAEHENLVALVDRMKTLTWGEDWAVATEKLDRNPHIPKPIEEQVKIIVDDVVEKATEDKKEQSTEEKKEEEKGVKEEEEKKEEAEEEKTE